MQEYSVILTWEAVYDVTDIADYIEAEFGMDRADRFQLEIREQMDKLEYMGSMFRKTQILYRNYAIHMKPFPPSLIFYIVEQEKKEIHVLRVLREERDWERIMSEDFNYHYE